MANESCSPSSSQITFMGRKSTDQLPAEALPTPTIPSRACPLLTQQPAFGGGGGSKHAFLLLWGDFAQAKSRENIAFQPTKGRGCDLLSGLGHQGYNTWAHQLRGGDTANSDLSSSAPAWQRGCCRQCIPAWCSSVAPKAFTVTLEAESPFKPTREKAGLRQVPCLAFSWKLWQWVSSYVGS